MICTELEIAEVGLPFTLLEELFDTQTIPACERVFNYLESRVERLTAGMEGGKGKALILLRLCNELLRRLSKAEDTIFCGRILIFLSKSFPISERSAVNLRGDFNVENVTIFDNIPDVEGDEMEVDISTPQEPAPSDESVKGGKSVSFSEKGPALLPISTDKLYMVFWSMQNDFADPTKLFVPANFERFKKSLEATMLKFREADEESVKITGGMDKSSSSSGSSKKAEDKKPSSGSGGGGSGSGAVTGEKRKRAQDDDGGELKGGGFNPKYLTSRELFELEVSDP